MNDVYTIGSYSIALVALVVKLLKDDEKNNRSTLAG